MSLLVSFAGIFIEREVIGVGSLVGFFQSLLNYFVSSCNFLCVFSKRKNVGSHITLRVRVASTLIFFFRLDN